MRLGAEIGPMEQVKKAQLVRRQRETGVGWELGLRFNKIRTILGWLKGEFVRERRQPVGCALGMNNRPKYI